MTILKLPKQFEIHVLNLDRQLTESEVSKIAVENSVNIKRYCHYESKGNAAFHKPLEYPGEISFPPQISCIIKYSSTDLGKYENAQHLEGFPNENPLTAEYGPGIYQWFIAIGDAMIDKTIKGTPDQAVLITKEVENWRMESELGEAIYGWVIYYKDIILFRNLTNVNIQQGTSTCKAYNNTYPDFEINLTDVSRIFKVLKRQY